LLAPAVTTSGTSGVDITNSTLGSTSGVAGSFKSGVNPKYSTTSTLTVSSSGTIQFSQANLNASQITIDGGGTVGGASTINAGALSVTGSSINLSGANIAVGSGHVSLGSDSALLNAIRSQSTGLAPASLTSPNAAFSAPGGVTLGNISVAGGYLFISSPSLQLPSGLSGSGLFVDYLPSNTSATFPFNPPQSLSGIATLVIGGTPETGTIQVGSSTQTLALTTNLVFATSGVTQYANTISTSGEVLVLNEGVLSFTPSASASVALSDIPITTTQYEVESPDQGVLGYTADNGDIDFAGVNNANRGMIDQKSQDNNSTAQSCGTGGAP
jgi:hypothetical protein